MDDLLDEFLTETNEHLEIVDQELVRFEQDPDNKDILRNVFRLVHTIKGTCGFLGLPRLESLAHAAETVMGHLRDGAPVTPEAVTLILQTIDRIKAILNVLGRTAAEPEGEDNDLIIPLDEMSARYASGEIAAEVAGGSRPLDIIALDGDDVEDDDGPNIGTLTFQILERPLKPGEVSLDELERVFRETSGPEFAGPEFAEEMVAAPAALTEATKPVAAEQTQTLAQAFTTTAAPEPQDLAAARQAQPQSSEKPAAKPAAKPMSQEALGLGDEHAGDGRGAGTQTIRVNVDTLEHLMTMVSELVLTRNQLLEIARRSEDSGYKVPLQRLSHITAELQDGVMKTRMQPIGNAWGKLPRIVRDLSAELGKKIDLVQSGSDTELDRQVLELIKDPLTHMVRNSADHGIEAPAERRAAGKPDMGTIHLSAFHEGGSITIEIKDDGRGLNMPRIREKVIEKGLATEAEVERMPEHQLARFIFHPGFSTAAAITAVSGRGVGMDVVKSNIDAIGGVIDVATKSGEGTTLTIKIPLTLAIVAALIVAVGDQRFAIPQVVVRELVRVKQGSQHTLETINGSTVLRLRDRLLPVIALSSVMKLGTKAEPDTGFVVVTQIGGRHIGLLVEGVFHTEEIVVKPMSGKLKKLSVFSGNTILGDGAVVLIIDPNGVSKLIGSVDGETEDEEASLGKSGTGLGEAVTMLVFKGSDDSLRAIPLSLVTRLEEIDASRIEHSGSRPVLQYRGKLTPIVSVDDRLELRREGIQPLIIFSDGERTMGLAVESIVDIVEEAFEIELNAQTGGASVGSAVIRGRVTDILDIAHYLPMAYPDWLQGTRRAATAEPHVLLVDSSDFFREMLVPVLKAAGWRVSAVSAGTDALAMIEAGKSFSAIVLDLDAASPGGLSLATALANNPDMKATRMIGRVNAPTAAAAEAARAAGVSHVIAKFDRRGLISALADLQSDMSEAA
ncbi:MAG: chemotaxis protein CheW [Bosea sp. (in: a-proteobacteria)]